MNKNLVLGIGTIVVLILGIGGYFFLNKTNEGKDSTNTNQIAVGEPSSSKSLKELANMSAQTCSLKSDGVDGVIYVDSGKVRGDFSSSVNNMSIKSHMIIDGKVGYMWTDNQNQGFKISLDEATSSNTSVDSKNNNIDINQKMDYKCSKWAIDSSVFALPTTIKFSNMSELLKPNSSSSPSAKGSDQSKCAACNSAPGDYKEQCLSALGCN